MNKKLKLPLIIIGVVMTLGLTHASAQNKEQYIRIARLIVDSTKLENYKQALKEHAEAAVKVEPGVLMLYAVYEKNNPTHLNVFEIYADEDAYKTHIQTAHFLKYKETV